MRTLFALILLMTPTVVVAEDWNGPYLGGGISYAMGQSEVVGNRFTYGVNAAEIRTMHEYEAVGVAAFAGWNERFGDVVFGAEISMASRNLSARRVFNSDNDIDQVDVDWTASMVGRVGYVFGQTMVYAGGGISYAGIRNAGGDVDSGILDLNDAHVRDEVRFGTTFLAGVELQIAEPWTLRAEYNRTDFSPYRQGNLQGAIPGTSQFYIVDNGPIEALTLALLFQF